MGPLSRYLSCWTGSGPNTVVSLEVSEHSRHFLLELGVVGKSVLIDLEEWDSW